MHNGDLDRVRAALREGIHVDTLDPLTGMTALHIAAGLGDAELTKFLIEEAGASFGPDAMGRPPVSVAIDAGAGDEQFFEYLMEKEFEAYDAGHFARHPSDARIDNKPTYRLLPP